MQWGFKSSNLPTRRGKPRSRYLRLQCFLWFSQMLVSQECSGRTGSPPKTELLQVPEPLVITVLLYTLVSLSLLSFTAWLSSPRRRKRDYDVMVIKIWLLLKGAKSRFAILEMFRLNLSSSPFVIRVNLLHHYPSLFLYGLLLSLWCCSI